MSGPQCRPRESRRQTSIDLFDGEVSFTSGHHGPCHSCDLVGERDRGDLGGPPCQQCRKPGPMLGAMDLGIADDGQCTRREQAAQIAISLFAEPLGFQSGRPLSHVRVAILALAPTDLTVDSLKASALFDLLVPPLHMVGLGVVLP
jgi:hypothetical protein